jgi:hypothetical protein
MITGRSRVVDLATHFEPRHRRQHPVEQHKVRLRLGDAHQRFLAIGGFLDTVSLFLEIVAQHRGERRLVFHDQHQRLGQTRWAVRHFAPPGFASGAHHSRGRTTA